MYGIFPRLKARAHQLAGTMSGGKQQMLAISRALMVRHKLLLLDEPSMGLTPIIVQKIFETPTEVVKGGVTLLLVRRTLGWPCRPVIVLMSSTLGALPWLGTATTCLKTSRCRRPTSASDEVYFSDEGMLRVD
ncbi:ATP-binding cassette domain-containing protein [Pseudomonas fulva]|jgi:ABC-type phosphate transport system ATPase subunit|uniref:ATP-binding cassette domain-containing protein n=1 Tax=Pseudomonas fulva TaxID=47880 RepID=UPI00381B753B